MNLIKITIKGFRAIRQSRTIYFSPGLNIIKGSDNEAGKSSLRMAITKALFQDPTSKSKEVLGLTSWGVDEPWEVELEFEADLKHYRITKSPKDGTCRLINLSSNTVITTNKNAITAKIAEFTGCPSEIFFLSTACLEQEEMIRIIPEDTTDAERRKALGTISNRLQATISGSEGADVTNILAKLYSKIYHMDAKGPKWHLDKIEKRLKELRIEKIDPEDKVNKLVKNRKDLNRIEKELEEVSRELPPKQQLLDKNNRIKELQDKIEKDKENYERLKRAKKLKQELDETDADLKRNFACFAGKENIIAHLRNINGELQNLAQRKSSREEDAEKHKVHKPASWMLASGIAMLIIGIIGASAISIYAAIVAIIGLVLLVYWLTFRKYWRHQMGLISSDIAELEVKIKEQERLMRERLNVLGFDDYSQYLRQYEQYISLEKEKKEITDELRGVTGDKSWTEFEQENEDLEIRISAEQKELEKLLPFQLEPLSLQKLETEVEHLKNRHKYLENEKHALERFFQYTDADTDQLASIEEEIKWLEEERQFWEKKQNIYEITRKTLDEAHRQTLSRAANILEKELGRYVSIITNGRYSQVKIDETDLSIKTFSLEKGEPVDVTSLSRATQDQFYICARFALVKLITEGKQPPLLLDDPFVNFHPKRLDKTISLLQELAKENQILLFTCSDAFDNCGNVIWVD